MGDLPPESGDREIPWKPPVIAAIIGGLLVATFVIFAIVTGPVEDPEAYHVAALVVPSTDVPPGYTVLSNGGDVGIKVESLTSEGGSTIVVVSSAVAGTTEPADSLLPDVAYWEMGPDDASVLMTFQMASDDATGTTTVVFANEAASSEMSVVGHPAVATAWARTDLEVSPDTIGQPVAFVVEVEPGIAITGSVTVGDGWGLVEWEAPDGMVATLDVEVTFVGTENPSADVLEPIRLVPVYNPELARPGTVISPRPLDGFGGRYTLYGDGRSLSEGAQATAIVIALHGIVVTETGEPVILQPPTG